MQVSRQIGWSQESNLLYQILKQLNQLTSVIFGLKPKYKVYTALLTQTGTDAPVATVLENTGNFGNWTYGGGGTYYLNYDPTLTPVIAPFGNFAGIGSPYIPIYAGFSGPNGVINGWYSIYPQSAGLLRLDFWNSSLVVGSEMSDIMGTTALYVDIKFY